jgi:hypothetical protein
MVGEMRKEEKRYLFTQEGTERTREAVINENFTTPAHATSSKASNTTGEKAATLNQLKAKIVRLYSKRLQSITFDTKDHTLLQGERISLFHLLKMRTHRAARMITSVLETDGPYRRLQRTFCTPL